MIMNRQRIPSFEAKITLDKSSSSDRSVSNMAIIPPSSTTSSPPPSASGADRDSQFVASGKDEGGRSSADLSSGGAGERAGIPSSPKKKTKRMKLEPGPIDVANPKPKRPLSSYNHFFHAERRRILDSMPDARQAASATSGGGSSPKRPRSHGKIGFAALARTIASRWKDIDPDTRKPYDDMARTDKERYEREMSDWKKRRELLQMELMAMESGTAPACMDQHAAARESSEREVLMATFDPLSVGSTAASPAQGTTPDSRMWMSSVVGDGGPAGLDEVHSADMVLQHIQQLQQQQLQAQQRQKEQQRNDSQKVYTRNTQAPNISDLFGSLDQESIEFIIDRFA